MIRLRTRLLALLGALIAAAPAAAQYDNDRLRDEILALGVAHNLAFAPSFSPDPFIGLNAGNPLTGLATAALVDLDSLEIEIVHLDR